MRQIKECTINYQGQDDKFGVTVGAQLNDDERNDLSQQFLKIHPTYYPTDDTSLKILAMCDVLSAAFITNTTNTSYEVSVDSLKAFALGVYLGFKNNVWEPGFAEMVVEWDDGTIERLGFADSVTTVSKADFLQLSMDDRLAFTVDPDGSHRYFDKETGGQIIEAKD